MIDRADRRGALAPLVLEEPLERRGPGEPDPAVLVGPLQRRALSLATAASVLEEMIRRSQVRALGALLLRVTARAEVLEHLLRPLRDRLRRERPGLQVLLEHFGDDLLVAKDRVHSRARRLSSGHAVGRRKGQRGRPARPAHVAGSGCAVDAVPVVIRHGSPSRLKCEGIDSDIVGKDSRAPSECRRHGLANVLQRRGIDGTPIRPASTTALPDLTDSRSSTGFFDGVRAPLPRADHHCDGPAGDTALRKELPNDSRNRRAGSLQGRLQSIGERSLEWGEQRFQLRSSVSEPGEGLIQEEL